MNYTIGDLIMAGVNWELSDTSNRPKEKHPSQLGATVQQPQQDTASLNKNTEPKSTAANIIAPSKPNDSCQCMECAVTAARDATDWNSLMNAIDNFAHPIREFAKNTVLPKGPANVARFVVITDFPSGDDEENAKVLSGCTGDLFDKMIGAIGIGRDDIAIIPLTFWRAPGGRTPTTDEVALCRPFVLRAIELMDPGAILTLGTVPAAEIAKSVLPRQHGEATTAAYIDMPNIPVVPIFHPNYVMLKPDAKKPVWDALQKLLEIL